MAFRSSISKFSVIFGMVILIEQLNKNGIEAVPVTNKMRYSTSSTPIEPLTIESMFETSASYLSPQKNIYRLIREPNKGPEQFEVYNSLDDEDRSLLAQFYQNSKETETFNPIGTGSLSAEAPWKTLDQDYSGLKALLDFQPTRETQYQTNTGQTHASLGDNLISGWTIDNNQLLSPSHKPSQESQKLHHQSYHKPSASQASYSPTLKLLTSYDPIDEAAILNTDGRNSVISEPINDSIKGTTSYSFQKDGAPSMSSKSALEAIKLHDDLLKNPPRDGKTRVRMYYHRAIHDDKRFYGNGPWKYWGHGWGLEFGFDPKSLTNENSYQKGYTIERAFGRDFCIDKTNCRKPDPNFFTKPQSFGPYSKRKARQDSRVNMSNADERRITILVKG